MAKAKTVDARAVEIAATVMYAAGLCRYDDIDKCRRVLPNEAACEACIKNWLLGKARRELRAERKSDE